MGLIEWIKSDSGVQIVSFLWGMGFSFLFYSECKKRGCMVIESPPIQEIQKKTFSMSGNDGECFRYEPVFVKCKKQN
jgi:hypothetical protein